MKFNRKYRLSLETAPNVVKTNKGDVANAQNVTIELPYTIEFEVNRNTLSSSQTASFKLYNLGEKTRNLIYKDKYAVTEFRAIQFWAGYEDFTPLLFNGCIKQAYSYREGVNFITVIEAYDGAFQMVNSFVSTSIAAGSTDKQKLKLLSEGLPKTTGEPIIGDFPNVSKRGQVFSGNAWQYLNSMSGGRAIIDNGQVKILNDDEVFIGDIPVINSESGLLNSPKRSDAQLEFDMLFEPRFSVGQVVKLESQTNAIFNGIYKTMGFVHTGTISPVVSGECKTAVSLWLGAKQLKIINGTPVT